MTDTPPVLYTTGTYTVRYLTTAAGYDFYQDVNTPEDLYVVQKHALRLGRSRRGVWTIGFDVESINTDGLDDFGVHRIVATFTPAELCAFYTALAAPLPTNTRGTRCLRIP